MSRFRSRAATAHDLPTLARWLGREVTTGQNPDECLWVAQASDPAQPLRAMLRLRRAIGLDLPRVSYHVGCVVHAAPTLKLFHRQRTLLMGNDHTGASELCDIAWEQAEVPLAEPSAALHCLVQAALQQLRLHRATYAARLIVELPGQRHSDGQSPFWQGLGRHFYGGDPAAAALAHGPQWRSHVAALLPRQTLVSSFLSPAAQAAIAQVAPWALPLREVLEDAGLRYSHHVNVEDGGPVLEAATDDLVARA